MSVKAAEKSETKGQESTTKTDVERAKMLAQFTLSINKKYGANTVIVGGSEANLSIPRVSSGSPEIDDILGGGFPKGRIVEIYGPEASGKSTICFSTMAALQKKGGMIGYVDTEHAIDESYLNKLGVDLKKVAFSQPSSAEEALSIVENMVDSKLFDLIVLDSVAALVPQSEIDGEMGDASMGKAARLMGQALRKLTGKVSESGTVLVFINQLRMKIGVMYGNPETTTGGNALKFFASVRLDVRRKESIKDGENVIGQKMTVKTAKIKVAQPFKTAEVSLIYGLGFDQITGVYDEAVAKGILVKIGGNHYWKGDKNQKLASKRSEMIERLKADPELLEEVKKLNAITKVGDATTKAGEDAG